METWKHRNMETMYTQHSTEWPRGSAGHSNGDRQYSYLYCGVNLLSPATLVCKLQVVGQSFKYAQLS